VPRRTSVTFYLDDEVETSFHLTAKQREVLAEWDNDSEISSSMFGFLKGKGLMWGDWGNYRLSTRGELVQDAIMNQLPTDYEIVIRQYTPPQTDTLMEDLEREYNFRKRELQSDLRSLIREATSMMNGLDSEDPGLGHGNLGMRAREAISAQGDWERAMTALKTAQALMTAINEDKVREE